MLFFSTSNIFSEIIFCTICTARIVLPMTKRGQNSRCLCFCRAMQRLVTIVGVYAAVAVLLTRSPRGHANNRVYFRRNWNGGRWPPLKRSPSRYLRPWTHRHNRTPNALIFVSRIAALTSVTLVTSRLILINCDSSD